MIFSSLKQTAVMSFLILLIINSSLLSSTQDYFQQNVDYKIQVTLHPQDKTYSGKETVTYKNNSDQTLSFIWFHFYPNAYKNESTPYAKQQAKNLLARFHFTPQAQRGYLDLISAHVAEQELEWEYKKDAIDEIKIYLPEPLPPGEQVTIDLEFEGKFPKVLSRMGYFGKNYFSATQWYPKVVVFDRDGWHPDSYLDMGEFYGEFGDFDVQITLPENFVIDATGLLTDNPEEAQFIADIVKRTNEYAATKSKKERKKFINDWLKIRAKKTDYNKTKTVRFVANNVHDFAWFAGDRYMMYQSKHNDGVLTNVLVQPRNAYAWREAARFVEQTIWFYGSKVGKYEYPKASVVNGSQQGFTGGMEYPMITNITIPNLKFVNLLEVVVMHEVGHNWFYGMLGSDERKEAFLDEGLNSFLELKYMEHFHGYDNLTNFKKLTKIDWLEDIGEWHLLNLSYGMLVSTKTDLPMNLRSEEYNYINYGGITYHKGALMLLALEWMLGPDTFWRGMKSYFNEWTGKHPRSSDFFDIMSDASGKDLDWFHDAWVTKTTYNDFVIKNKETQKTPDGGYETKVYVKNKGSMKGMPAPVHLITEEGDTLEGRWEATAEHPAVIQHASPSKKIEVNLKRSIFETNYLNNNSLPDFDLNFIGQIPRFDTYPINIYPYYWYEEFEDKNRIGLGFWAGNPLYKQWSANGSFYHATGSNKWGYQFGLSQRFTGWIFNYTEIAAGIRDKSGLQNVSLETKIRRQSPYDNRLSTIFNLGFDYVNFHDPIYSEKEIFETAKYTTVTAGSEFRFRRLLQRFAARLDAEKAFGAEGSDVDYFKLAFISNYRYRFTRILYAKARLYGCGIWGDDLPSQERIYLGGDVDPKFERFAVARRGDWAPLRNWTYETGMNMPGYARANGLYPSGKAGASMSVEIKYRRYCLPAFYGTGGTLSPTAGDFGSDDFIAETGLKVEAGPIKIILPLYITDPPPGEKHFDFRFFMNVNLLRALSL